MFVRTTSQTGNHFPENGFKSINAISNIFTRYTVTKSPGNPHECSVYIVVSNHLEGRHWIMLLIALFVFDV